MSAGNSRTSLSFSTTIDTRHRAEPPSVSHSPIDISREIVPQELLCFRIEETRSRTTVAAEGTCSACGLGCSGPHQTPAPFAAWRSDDVRCFSLRGQCILLFLDGQLTLKCGRGKRIPATNGGVCRCSSGCRWTAPAPLRSCSSTPPVRVLSSPFQSTIP